MLPLLALPFVLPLLPSTLASSSSSSSPHHAPRPERQNRHRSLASKHLSPRLNSARQTTTTSTTSLDPNPPLGGFDIMGDSGVSAQMMFLGTKNTVFILDKSENNSLSVTTPQGITHPAWATSYSLASQSAEPMSVASNTFCAGGFALGNGTWAVFGGNQPVTYEGVAVSDTGKNPTGANPYYDADGGAAIRMLDPCDDGACSWVEGLSMTGKRWYPTIEGLGDGSLIILGGDTNGGYVSTQIQNNPTYEFFPQKGAAVKMQFLVDTVPLNLFPLTWLMPSGKLFMQAAMRSILYDLDSQTQTELAAMPYASRVYPSSAAAVMLPLTPANNYTATILFCGGSAASYTKSSDGGAGYNVTAVPADDTCVRINPDDANPEYEDDDNLPEGRSMGQLIYLPDGTMWLGNGVAMGTAGYGDELYSFGQSYGQEPIYSPAIYNPSAPSGSRFSRDGLTDSTQERMYHSTAILLADGAILVSGSNPNKDVTYTKWGTSYSVEKWYPKWYSQQRPVASAWPTSLSYGGDAWDVSYTPTNTSSDPGNTKVVVIRTGFSTHCMNFGQRYLELATSYTKVEATGEVTMHVAQLPPNANLFQPGPAMIFLVVDGVPSMGEMVMVGNGQVGTQPLSATTVLPQSRVVVADASSTASSNATEATGNVAAASGKASGAPAGLAAPPSSSVFLALSAVLLGASAFLR